MNRFLLYALAIWASITPAFAAFSYSRSITIDHTQCGASDSTNFPVLVSISDATFKDTGHGGHVSSSSGADILFFSDSGLTAQIASQIESYDNANGILLAWVKVGTVSHTSNTVFYVGYGNAGPPSRTANPWDTNFIARYHLDDNATNTTVFDATANANNAVNQSNTSTRHSSGQVGGALNYSSVDFATLPSGNTFGASLTTMTVSAWFRLNSLSGTENFVIHDQARGTDVYGIYEILGQTRALIGTTFVTGPTISDTTTWHQIGLTYDGTTFTLYVDGTSRATTTSVGYVSGNNATTIGPPNSGDAAIDEVSISTGARSADWILTEYNNQRSPGNIGAPAFLTYGAEPGSTHDTLPPVLNSFSISPTTVNAQGGPAVVSFSFTATDDLSGVAQVSLSITGATGVSLSSALRAEIGTPIADTLQVVLPQYSGSGTWTVTSVMLKDAVGNATTLNTTALTAAGFPTTFTVQ